jgi:hypothetical protein
MGQSLSLLPKSPRPKYVFATIDVHGFLAQNRAIILSGNFFLKKTEKIWERPSTLGG